MKKPSLTIAVAIVVGLIFGAGLGTAGGREIQRRYDIQAQAAEAEVPGEYMIVNGACDKNGGVTAIQVATSKAGVYTLQWDNKVVCGTPA